VAKISGKIQAVQIETWRLVRGDGVEIVAETSASLWFRMGGLLFKPCPEAGKALWLQPCNAIHMLGMKYPLDVIFLDKNLKIVKLIEDICPNHFSPLVFKAHSVLEMRVGQISKLELKVGDIFQSSRIG
jgi:uncharacterized membrane protein (UPF0127 family)